VTEAKARKEAKKWRFIEENDKRKWLEYLK